MNNIFKGAARVYGTIYPKICQDCMDTMGPERKDLPYIVHPRSLTAKAPWKVDQ